MKNGRHGHGIQPARSATVVAAAVCVLCTGFVRGSAPGPRILLVYDMEGISGIDTASMVVWPGHAYEEGQRLLAADVNAVVDGLFRGGASDVAVVDYHGSGIPGDQNLPPDSLDRRARLLDVHRPWFTQGQWDAVALVGMHAAGGSGGFLAHTFSPGGVRMVNGVLWSETDNWAHGAADLKHIPVIFVSGDDVLHQHVREVLPWVVYVEVKRTLRPSRAELYDESRVLTALREGATRAVGRLDEARLPPPFATPVTVTFRATPPTTLLPLFDAHLPDYEGKLQVDSDSVVSITIVRDSVGFPFRDLSGVIGLAHRLGVQMIRASRIADNDSAVNRIMEEQGYAYESRVRH
jgi:D-amino peptidase